MSKASEQEAGEAEVSMVRVELAGIFADSFAEVRKGASVIKGIGLANAKDLSDTEKATIEEISEKLVEAAGAMNYLIGLLDG